jgi:hypothetical protein
MASNLFSITRLEIMFAKRRYRASCKTLETLLSSSERYNHTDSFTGHDMLDTCPCSFPCCMQVDGVILEVTSILR